MHRAPLAEMGQQRLLQIGLFQQVEHARGELAE